MINWVGRITADDAKSWGEYGPRLYIDGTLVGTIDISSADPREECGEFDMEDCSLAYLEGEGDVSIPGGWHEWWDCDPDESGCSVLSGWLDELEEGLADPELLGELGGDADTVQEVIDGLEDAIPDSFRFSFVPESR